MKPMVNFLMDEFMKITHIPFVLIRHIFGLNISDEDIDSLPLFLRFLFCVFCIFIFLGLGDYAFKHIF